MASSSVSVSNRERAASRFAAWPWLSLVVPLFFAVFGLLMWWLLPPDQLKFVLREGNEGGLIEGASVVLWLVVAVAAWLVRPTRADAPFRWRLSLLMLAFAAREMELHKPARGFNVLKPSFYLGSVDLTTKIAVGVFLILILCCAVWVLWRGVPRLRRGVRERHPVACSMVVFLLLLPLLHVLDRSFNVLRESFGLRLNDAARSLIAALEEPLELALPLVALVALAQYGLQRGSERGLEQRRSVEN